MRVVRTITVKLHDLKLNLFVRKELDTERALFLSELIEAGVKMADNIKVTKDFVVVDGRHRYEGYDLNKVTEIEVDVVDIDNEVDLISEAYRANIGGSKPPTAEDTDHTVELLLERKQSISAIGKLLALPNSMARKYVSEVKSRLNRARMMAAVEAVVHGGLTAAQSAEKFEVELDKLKEQLSGTRKRHKANKHGVEELQRKLTFNYKSLASSNASYMRKILDKFDDGDMLAEQVGEVICHIESLQKKQTRAIADWRRRFEAKCAEKSGKPAEESAA